MRLLLVDDDAELGNMLEEFFRTQNLVELEIDHELNGASALSRILTYSYDLIVLDVMLPGMDGFEVLQHLRRTSSVPVLMLTAKATRQERVRGLELGADDYLGKPFGPDELLARIRAILRRAHSSRDPSETLQAGEIELLPGTREAFYRGRALALTAMECEILEQLIRSKGRVVSRDQITMHLYKRATTAFDRSVDTHITRIRRKLGDGRDLILSVRGTGYQLRLSAEAES